MLDNFHILKMYFQNQGCINKVKTDIKRQFKNNNIKQTKNKIKLI